MGDLDLRALEDIIFRNGGFSSGVTLGEIISAVLPMVWSAAGIVLLALLIFAGFQFMTSGGDPRKKAAAQGKITDAIVGFVIVFAAFWIVELVGIIFGIDAITSTDRIFTN
ncbi:hypothetical protein JXA63_02300 [Candidatus Woesebacteria bacterium]|nr:hypothetical protein [Candidatus Woesebacteria bacterium]